MSLTFTEREIAKTEIDLVHIRWTIYLMKLEITKIVKLPIMINTFSVDCYWKYSWAWIKSPLIELRMIPMKIELKVFYCSSSVPSIFVSFYRYLLNSEYKTIPILLETKNMYPVALPWDKSPRAANIVAAVIVIAAKTMLSLILWN